MKVYASLYIVTISVTITITVTVTISVTNKLMDSTRIHKFESCFWIILFIKYVAYTVFVIYSYINIVGNTLPEGRILLKFKKVYYIITSSFFPATVDIKFVCQSCGKKYKRKGLLSRHLRYECGKEPQFACPYCSYRAKHKYSIQCHIGIKHSHTLMKI